MELVLLLLGGTLMLLVESDINPWESMFIGWSKVKYHCVLIDRPVGKAPFIVIGESQV